MMEIDYLILAIFFVFWLFLIINSYVRKIKFPWEYLLFLLGFVFSGVQLNITIGFTVHLSLILPILIFFFAIKIDYLSKYYITKKNISLSLFCGLVIGVLLVIIAIVFFDPTQFLPNDADAIDLFSNPIFLLRRALEIAIVEELIFRSILIAQLKEQNFQDFSTFVIQSIIFTVAHLPRYYRIGYFPALVLVGLAGLSMGYITLKFKNVFGAIFCHFLGTILPTVYVLYF